MEPSSQINRTVNLTTDSSLIIKYASGSANNEISSPNRDIEIIESRIAPQPDLLAWLTSNAPKCWPTSVAPAMENPNPITKENERIWTPIPYAA